MPLTFADVRNMKLPMWEVATAVVGAVAITWAAFAWADDLIDKQSKTQDQLDQLITIVSTSTSQNNEVHNDQEENIADVRQDFELLKQEMELRRELTRERDTRDNTEGQGGDR